MDEPEIKKGSYQGREISTTRGLAQQRAASMDIDTKGMSTKEIRVAISEKQEAQKELGDFIKQTVANLPKVSSDNKVTTSSVTTSQQTQTPSSNIKSGGSGRGSSGGGGIPIEFYCWKDGVVGTIKLTASQDFKALPPA
jgi:hypothetical protein